MGLVRSNRFKNLDLTIPVTCELGCVVGDVVYMVDSRIVARVDPLLYAKMPAAGVMIAVSGVDGVLATGGVIYGIYSGLIPGGCIMRE